MPAELDYAYLADYAVVEGGRLTAIGASFTHMRASGLPLRRPLSIAGRVRTGSDSDGFQLGVSVAAPGKQWKIGFDAFIPADEAVVYDQKKGVVFAIQANLLLTDPGLYEVRVLVESTAWKEEADG